MTSLMLAGLGIAGAAFGARFLMQSYKQIQKHASNLPKSPLFTAYYKGGFDPKMTRREAGLILGKRQGSDQLVHLSSPTSNTWGLMGDRRGIDIS